MKRIILRSVGGLLGLIVVLYIVVLVSRAGSGVALETQTVDTSLHRTIALFGATGTIGDGLLKAVLNDSDTHKIHVVTRRSSPRIVEGVESGKVVMTTHMDYRDYSAIREILAEVDAVYWAIGLSAVGLDQETYREIHATFPLNLVREWLEIGGNIGRSFHYVSGSGANADSRMMWGREKARAESELANLVAGSNLRVISYRPSFILPTEPEAHLGHRILYAIFAPIKFAVAAQAIGEAMLEVSARGSQLANGTILENTDILGYAKAYKQRHSTN